MPIIAPYVELSTTSSQMPPEYNYYKEDAKMYLPKVIRALGSGVTTTIGGNDITGCCGSRVFGQMYYSRLSFSYNLISDIDQIVAFLNFLQEDNKNKFTIHVLGSLFDIDLISKAAFDNPLFNTQREEKYISFNTINKFINSINTIQKNLSRSTSCTTHISIFKEFIEEYKTLSRYLYLYPELMCNLTLYHSYEGTYKIALRGITKTTEQKIATDIVLSQIAALTLPSTGCMSSIDKNNGYQINKRHFTQDTGRIGHGMAIDKIPERDCYNFIYLSKLRPDVWVKHDTTIAPNRNYGSTPRLQILTMDVTYPLFIETIDYINYYTNIFYTLGWGNNALPTCPAIFGCDLRTFRTTQPRGLLIND